MPVSHETLRDILTKLQADPMNDDLWKLLYGEIRSFVYAIAYRALNARTELAQDATQVVFLRLFQYCEFTNFTDPGEFLAYVSTVTRHAALDLAHGERGYVTGLELTLCDSLPGRPTPRQLEKALNQLQDVLEHVGGEDQILAELLMQGFTLDDIAQRLGISYANAAVRIHRFRQKLLKYLQTG